MSIRRPKTRTQAVGPKYNTFTIIANILTSLTRARGDKRFVRPDLTVKMLKEKIEQISGDTQMLDLTVDLLNMRAIVSIELKKMIPLLGNPDELLDQFKEVAMHFAFQARNLDLEPEGFGALIWVDNLLDQED